MSAMGTDVLAVACILGGAVVSGAATLAAVRQGEEASCTVETIAIPRVAVGVGSGDGNVVVRPRVVRVHRGGSHGCATVVVDDGVRIRMDEVRARVGEARARAEQARVRADQARMRVEQVRVRAVQAKVLAEQARLRTITVPADQLQERLREEIARLQEELARLDEGAGGR